MKQKTAREVALGALLSMEETEGYSNLVLSGALESAQLSKRDASLAATLFYGVLERKLTLDWLIRSCLRDPKKKLDPTAQMALRCGAYQIFYLSRVPASAAVNETVSAVRAFGKRELSGFVNGVLRSLLRQKEALSLPSGDSPEELSIRYSVPVGLIGLWNKAYGQELTKKLLASFEERAGLDIRVNRARVTTEALRERLLVQGIELTPFAAPAFAARLSNCGSPAALREFSEGLFHVQDLSAQLVCAILAPQPGQTVVDCCAAPGGKTFTLSQEVGETGRVHAFDLYESRVGLIQDGASRLGLTNITACAADMTKPPEHPIPADRVLCDAPCSGFGVIRRKPEIRYKNLDDTKALPELQSAILANAAAFVAPGGVLVYSTCTLNPRENGKVAQRFLQEHGDFQPKRIELPGVSRVIEEPEHHLTMMPFSGASDGFFAAAFVRKTS